MCLAAFHTVSNIRKAGLAHLVKTPLGFFNSSASGLLRNRSDSATTDAVTLLVNNLAERVGTVSMFVTMVVLLWF